MKLKSITNSSYSDCSYPGYNQAQAAGQTAQPVADASAAYPGAATSQPQQPAYQAYQQAPGMSVSDSL